MGREIAQGMPLGTLYIVATPIGNLSDITYRAVEILKSVDIIACEDTRNTRILCDRYNINTRLISYHKFSECKKTSQIMNYLYEGKNVALVSDAGTPLVSDPGVKLVDEARKEGVNVVPVVGASAILALISSIPRTDEDFKFIGFLPREKTKIENLVKSSRNDNIVFYESPNRIMSTLLTVSKIRNGAKMALGRELTKKFEEIKVDTVENLIEYYNSSVLKGEIVCMLYKDADLCDNFDDIIEKIKLLKGLKLTDKDITGVINTLYGTPRNVIKDLCLKI